MSSPYLTFGLPRDGAALVALVMAAGCVLLARSPLAERLRRAEPRRVITVLCGLSALLSAAYVVHYLRGAPRIIDATHYYLEARAFAAGQLAFDVPAPSGSFRGRFLVTAAGEAQRLAVLFPPGYPAFLALGFLLGAPMLVGPLLAALLVAATYWLARELLGREDVARLAALLSTLSAALRYHTADTMSHGLAALLLTVALAAAARGGHSLWLCGGSLGWLIATRPVTGVVALGLCLAVALRHRARVLVVLLALAPGIALLLLHQRAATGSFWGSTQLSYYGLADGPPGCFGWGFGKNIGCLFEHGEYVRERLPSGYGPLEAALNTWRRLKVHSIDVANFAPFALLVPYAAVRYRKRPGVFALGLGVLAIVLAYSGFYFDGSYPGGGARFFADVLPLEHALLALALVELRGAAWAAPCALIGFALHAVHGHLQLAQREGGRPMFEASVVERAGVTRGIVFVSTDHGFALGHDPRVRDPWRGVLVARARGDAHDELLWERFGRPPAYAYRFDSSSSAKPPELEARPANHAPVLRFEAEAEWPPLAVHGGYAHPDFHPAPCVSSGRGLRLHGTGTDGASVTVEIAARDPGPHELVIQWLADRNVPLDVAIETAGRTTKVPIAELISIPNGPCRLQATKPIALPEQARLQLSLGATRSDGSALGGVLVDYIELRQVTSKMR